LSSDHYYHGPDVCFSWLSHGTKDRIATKEGQPKLSALCCSGGRAVTTQVLCPKCHGQRTMACPACNGLGGKCFAGVIIGICAQCHGGGRRCCDVCGGAAEVEPDTAHRFKQHAA